MVDLQTYPNEGVSLHHEQGAYCWIGEENPFRHNWTQEVAVDRFAQIVVVGALLPLSEYRDAIWRKTGEQWYLVQVAPMRTAVETDREFTSLIYMRPLSS